MTAISWKSTAGIVRLPLGNRPSQARNRALLNVFERCRKVENAIPKNYTIFGQVTDPKGLETLDKIANTPVSRSATGEMSVPTQDVRITSVDIAEK